MLSDTRLHDEFWMRHALHLADNATAQGEIPVGAVLVHKNQLIAEGWNRPIQLLDPTAHAEVVAIRAGAQALQNYRLLDTTLYVTLEPCVMCAAALLHARVKRVVFGAYDPKAGAAGSRFDVLRDTRHNHEIDCVGGVLAVECGEQLRQFFQEKREFI
ncbi:MAG: tRNA adenosine(34) deaminase TadA [Pseudomonadota bacterium]|jgi:tRNA(adenine34) deaminase